MNTYIQKTDHLTPSNTYHSSLSTLLQLIQLSFLVQYIKMNIQTKTTITIIMCTITCDGSVTSTELTLMVLTISNIISKLKVPLLIGSGMEHGSGGMTIRITHTYIYTHIYTKQKMSMIKMVMLLAINIMLTMLCNNN
jgi:hypothetical protein